MTFIPDFLRLYAVTDRTWLRGASLAEHVEMALDGGVTMVQLREKAMDETALLREAIELKQLCHRYNVPLLINDNVQIAMRSGADGVHLGQDDMNARTARNMLGRDSIIGVTAKTVKQAVKAQEDGANYLGSGAVFGSTTKQNAKPMDMETLRAICRAAAIPVVAIGGICQDNLAQLTGTGIAGVAVVSGIFAADNIREACRTLRETVDRMC
ncbi:MAG: thiamine phosphate synthase [Clostridia bacterium]|nr:thiamine phosphate synthase [Clostridia bacterium]